MSSVCSKVGKIKEPFNLTPEQVDKLLPLETYQIISQKLIVSHAKNLTNVMIKSEDAIAFVVDYLVRADVKWIKYHSDDEVYRLILRSKAGRFAIKKYSNKFRLEWKKSKNEVQLYNNVPSGKTPVKILIEKEERVINPNMLRLMSSLTETQKFCLICRYYGNMTLQQIGDEVNVERERIRQIIRKALLKLHKAIDGL